jgi:hypothetical protein
MRHRDMMMMADSKVSRDNKWETQRQFTKRIIDREDQ